MAEWFVWPDLPIRVTARGAWLHGDEPLHPKVQALFARSIVPQADGRYRVQLGYSKQELVVDVTPYFVRSLAPRLVAGALAEVGMSLSDGEQETLDPHTLMQDDNNVLYCRIKRHDLWVPCQFSPGQYYALSTHMQLDDAGKGCGVLVMAGEAWPIQPYDARPICRP